MYSARVLADSVSPDDVRLITMEIVYPRFIHSELMTHRMFSRNAASSRAIPPNDTINPDGSVKKGTITMTREDPFVPETFNARVKGMGVGEALDERTQQAARAVWENAANYAASYAEQLAGLGVDKSRVNRLLEPFLWMKTIVSATEWDNFFGLRDHPAAQPEFQILARLMKETIRTSVPQRLDYGMWHLPLVSDEELAELRADHHLLTMFKMVSAGRCARVSYDTHENFETRQASYRRAETLMGNGHFSPFEHVARPMDNREVHGILRKESTHYFFANFRGWVQFRSEIPNESDFSKAVA